MLFIGSYNSSHDLKNFFIHNSDTNATVIMIGIFLLYVRIVVIYLLKENSTPLLENPECAPN